MPDQADALSDLRRVVNRAQAERRVPGLAAAVGVRGQVVLAEAVGLAVVEPERDATPETQYRIGSISKSFTAAVVLALRDEGRLRLDDPLSRFLGEVPHGELRLSHLLTHLGGLQREPVGEVWESMRPPSRDELLAGLGDAEAVLPPGERWHYSNLAYSLLGEVATRAAGKPYAEVVAERFLRPLGLERTGFRGEAPAARGYLVEPWWDGVRPEPELDDGAFDSAGGLWSTVGDLVRWGSFLAAPDPAVLAPDTVEAMHVPRIVLDPDAWTRAWGLGLELRRRGELVLAGHGGAMPGYLAALALSRREQVVAAVLANTTARFDPWSVAAELVERAIAGWPRGVQPWRPLRSLPELATELVGRWWSEGAEFVFSYRDGHLTAQEVDAPAGAEPAIFVPEGPDRFRTERGAERGELLRVVRADDGRVEKLYWATYPFTREVRTFGATREGT